MRYGVLTILLFVLAIHAKAQYVKGNEFGVLNLNFTYGGHLPAADFSERFGPHFSAGLGLEYMTHPSNVIIGAELYYQFGGNVNDDVLSTLLTEDGGILGNDLLFASIRLRQRGLYSGFLIGKLFPFNPDKNQKAGLRFTIGAGYFWHKIRVQDDFDTAPQFSGDYIKGYDRLTGGLGITQFIGYQQLDRARLANFFFGFEFLQGFTQGLRNFDFPTRTVPEGRRLELNFGIRLGWTLPFYVGQPSSTIYY